MRPLGEDDSRNLFFIRIFGSGEAFPDVFEELSADILKKCGGLPLAIMYWQPSSWSIKDSMGVCTEFSRVHV